MKASSLNQKQIMSAYSIAVFLGSLSLNLSPALASPFAYISSYDTISVIDTAKVVSDPDDAVVSNISLPFANGGTIGFAPNGAFAYRANNCYSCTPAIFVVDTTKALFDPSNAVVSAVPVPGSYPYTVNVTPNGAFAYVTHLEYDFIDVIDTVKAISDPSNAVVASVPYTGGNYSGVAFTPGGKYAIAPSFVSGTFEAAVSIIDTTKAVSDSDNAILATAPLGVSGGGFGVAISPNGEVAYVLTNSYVGTSYVVVVDIAKIISDPSHAVGTTIPVGRNPRSIAITPNGAYVYVANLSYAGDPPDSATLSVIETSTNTVIATIPESAGPLYVAVTPDSAFAYVTDSLGASVIDTSTNSVVETIPVQGAWHVAITPFARFASFTVGQRLLNTGSGIFSVTSNFLLSKVSNGIDPARESMELTIGNFTTTIPAGSFQKTPIGPWFRFSGQIDHVLIQASIQSLGNNRFLFKTSGVGADFTGIKNPVAVQLIIGDDIGIASVNATIHP